MDKNEAKHSYSTKVGEAAQETWQWGVLVADARQVFQRCCAKATQETKSLCCRQSQCGACPQPNSPRCFSRQSSSCFLHLELSK